MSLMLESPVFAHKTFIPKEYTCSGADYPPPLIWHDPPPNTKSFALIMEDPDAVSGLWVHWLVFNLPADCRELRAGINATGQGVCGKNSWGKTAYGGPCPPSGTHHYFFKLYALDTELTLDKNATKQELENAMKNHILEEVSLIGLYSKSSSH
ncbi:YbhB/YbcL family Raf kinase inhibitor-like protein [Legionella jordanis]|uniref:Phosphatidylethanolamine-binding protein n=1 Tax=Legionella jordanis TaxID=456 RepID=A0A0W0V8E7_9GAMM|nr:YbhB/YbcL family Raf kinase inhibitor-like protein [Legionella jordanis]KTD16411.1 Phosphatidylethanolamine-binding protein [Legionella jordanis]RMX04387.1 YbhB/YbcL family Raf kinase inhibitor-like protein [Legionella jordanis]RMX15578.1 YbhB/YbcL family Raf kinase inhibitor-like protein [Legionella jordanis]VEH12128.1 Phosphatidylethanolamine-binding protein [Legionella jordanis]